MGKWLLQAPCCYGGPDSMMQSHRSSFTAFQECAEDSYSVVAQRRTNNIRLRF